MSNADMRLETLETKVTFQEDTIQQLNEVVIAQDARIHDLEASFRLLLENIRDQAQDQEINQDDEPPPHY